MSRQPTRISIRSSARSSGRARLPSLPTFALDASAVVALVRRETGWSKVNGALRSGAAIAAPNLAEALTVVRRRGDSRSMAEVAALLRGLGLDVVDVRGNDTQEICRLLLESERILGASVSLGDAICMAVANRLGYPIICSDKSWSRLSLPVRVGQFR